MALVAMLALVLGAPAGAAAATNPAYDPFYNAPAELASLKPGAVIRSRATRMSTLPGLVLPFKVHQVLYRTNDASDKPVAVVATIILPVKRPAKHRRLISYQTAYDGLSTSCQPSYSLVGGHTALQGAETLLMTALLSRGWTIVTTDYEGPNNAFAVGRMAGHAVLDGIRAAEAYEPAGLDDEVATKVGMMGYSGGGHATAWANELAATYAPELNIVGATEGGLPISLPNIYAKLDGGFLGAVLLAALAGFDAGYPDANFSQYLKPKGRQAFRTLRKQCVSDYFAEFPFAKMKDYLTVPNVMEIPSMRAIADANTLGQAPPRAPTLLYMSANDEMGGHPDAVKLHRFYCEAGAKVVFKTGWAGEHAAMAFTMPNTAERFIGQRFNGAPAPDNCPPPD